MKLSELKDHQEVRYRLGRDTDGPGPAWGEWKTGNIYLMRRTIELPKALRRRSREPNLGDIISIGIRDAGFAEFSQSDYESEFNTFHCEDYLLQIEGLTP